MSGPYLGWTFDETAFAIVAIFVLALGVLGIDKLLFRPKRKPPAPRKQRRHRVSYVVEEIEDQDANGTAVRGKPGRPGV